MREPRAHSFSKSRRHQRVAFFQAKKRPIYHKPYAEYRSHDKHIAVVLGVREYNATEIFALLAELIPAERERRGNATMMIVPSACKREIALLIYS